jgi:hypothetical protein
MVDHITQISDCALCHQSERSIQLKLRAIAKVLFIGMAVASIPGVGSMLVAHKREEDRNTLSHEYLVQSINLANKQRHSDALILANMATKISPRSRACRANLLRLRHESIRSTASKSPN